MIKIRRNCKEIEGSLSEQNRSKIGVKRSENRGKTGEKHPSKWSFPCEMEDFMLWWFAATFAAAKWGPLCCEVALVCQTWFRSCGNFRREGYWAANWFRNKVPISQRLRNFADPCFSPQKVLFDSLYLTLLNTFE